MARRVRIKGYLYFALEGTENEKAQRDADDKEAAQNETVVKYRFKMVEVVPGVEELGVVQISLMEELQPNTKNRNQRCFLHFIEYAKHRNKRF